MHRALGRATVLGAVLASLACENAARDDVIPGALGSISVQLQLYPSIHLDAVAYKVEGANGFSRGGTFTVVDSTTISGTIPGIPLGSGYVITLSATSTDNPPTTCQGSAPFDLATAGAPVPVVVHISCIEPRPAHDAPPPAVPLSPSASAVLAVLLLGAGGRAALVRRR